MVTEGDPGRRSQQARTEEGVAHRDREEKRLLSNEGSQTQRARNGLPFRLFPFSAQALLSGKHLGLSLLSVTAVIDSYS